MKMQAYRPESPIWVMHTVVSRFPADSNRLGQVKGSFRIQVLEQSPLIEIDDVLGPATWSGGWAGRSSSFTG